MWSLITVFRFPPVISIDSAVKNKNRNCERRFLLNNLQIWFRRILKHSIHNALSSFHIRGLTCTHLNCYGNHATLKNVYNLLCLPFDWRRLFIIIYAGVLRHASHAITCNCSTLAQGMILFLFIDLLIHSRPMDPQLHLGQWHTLSTDNFHAFQVKVKPRSIINEQAVATVLGRKSLNQFLPLIFLLPSSASFPYLQPFYT